MFDRFTFTSHYGNTNKIRLTAHRAHLRDIMLDFCNAFPVCPVQIVAASQCDYRG